MAVEPFVGIDLKPGETKRWSYTYTYTAPHRSAWRSRRRRHFQNQTLITSWRP